jgi:hypothetical protein
VQPKGLHVLGQKVIFQNSRNHLPEPTTGRDIGRQYNDTLES